jgi:hypothetical protein
MLGGGARSDAAQFLVVPHPGWAVTGSGSQFKHLP